MIRIITTYVISFISSILISPWIMVMGVKLWVAPKLLSEKEVGLILRTKYDLMNEPQLGLIISDILLTSLLIWLLPAFLGILIGMALAIGYAVLGEIWFMVILDPVLEE